MGLECQTLFAAANIKLGQLQITRVYFVIRDGTSTNEPN